MKFWIQGASVAACMVGADDNPGAPVVVFVHGAGMDRTVWSDVIADLPDTGYRRLSPDLPGHGASDGSARPTVAAAADWLAVLVKAADFRPAHLVGHSLGAAIALETAARHPAVVQSLALLGIGATMPVNPDLLDTAETGPAQAIELIAKWSLASERQLGTTPDPNHRDATIAAMSRTAPLATDLRAASTWNGLEAAAAVTARTLIVTGEHDRMTPPASAQPLAETLANATLVTVASAGHMMQLEQTDQVVALLRDHLTKTT